MIRLLVLAAGCLGLPPALVVGQAPPLKQRLDAARALADSGRFADAALLYTQVLRQVRAADTGTRALAHFGRAFSVHRTLGATVDSTSRYVLDTLLGDYDVAVALDSARYFAPARHNAGLVYSATGRHQPAASAFLAAAQAGGDDRASSLVWAAREFEHMELLDSAAWAYAAALEADPDNATAFQSLLDLHVERGADARALSLAARGVAAQPASVLEALLELLERTRPPLGSLWADSALALTAGSLSAMYADPGYFTRNLGFRLALIATLHPSLSEPIDALRAAYAQTPRFPLPGGRWWSATVSRRAAWSQSLRALGDWWYWRGSADSLAMRFYESVVGPPDAVRFEPWTPFEAFDPLALIYAGRRRWEAADAVLSAVDQARAAGQLRHVEPSRIRDFYYDVGTRLTQLEQYDRAVTQLLKAATIDPSFSSAFVNLGYISQGLGELEAAARYYVRADSLDPDNAVGQNNLGFIRLLLGEFREAARLLERSFGLLPSLLTALNLGDAHRYAGNVDAALHWHRQAAELAHGARLDNPEFMGSAWRYNYMPLARGDRETIRRSVLVDDVIEKLAFVQFALGLDYALAGDLASAERAFAEGVRRASTPEFRCFFANKIAAIPIWLTPAPGAARWLDSKRRSLIEGLACPGTAAGG